MNFTSEKFQRAIEPFRFSSDEEQASFSLEASAEYLKEMFRSREAEGFTGNGYDWESLAEIFLAEVYEGEDDSFEFDSEADMFVVYSEDAESLANFALAFKDACEDEGLIGDLFSRAELR